MTISIGTIHYPEKSFHLLDIAMIVIEKCRLEINEKKGKNLYSFNLDIDFNLIWGTIDFHTLCISGDRYITLANNTNKTLSHTKEKWLGLDDISIPFSIPEYLRLLDDRIRYSLSAIGLVYVSSSLWDSSITVKFTIWANTLEDYKAELIEKLHNQLAFKTYWDVKDVESTMIAKIRSIAIDTKTTNLYIDTQDFWRLFDKLGHPQLFKRKTDIVNICDIYYPKNPLELMLYILLIRWYLLSVSEYRGKFKIDINPDNLEQVEPTIRPIKFYEDTGDVYLNDVKIWRLKPKQDSYKLFKVLYQHQNTIVPASDLMVKWGFISNTKSDENFIANKIIILKKHLGEDFVIIYIKRVNNGFVLWNKIMD